jgi:hypothetical protein
MSPTRRWSHRRATRSDKVAWPKTLTGFPIIRELLRAFCKYGSTISGQPKFSLTSVIECEGEAMIGAYFKITNTYYGVCVVKTMT